MGISNLCRGKPGRPVDPPDGGWGWLVALAGFVVSACSYGVMRSLGVFFVTWQGYFSVTAAETGLIQSIITGVLNLAAPIAGALSNRFGCRVVVMAGGVISSVGFVLSLWATSLFHLYVTVGFLTGFGYSLSLITTMATIGRYFTTHRLRANSFAAIGASFVSFAFPPLFQYLMDEYTWRGALVLIGGIVLHIAGFGALVRPILLKGDVNAHKTPGKVQESSAQSSRLSDNNTSLTLTTQKHSLTKVILDKIGSVIDIRLLTEPRFLLFCVAVFLFGFGRFVPNIYIVPRARAFGVEEYPSAFLLSILAIGDIIGRASVGLLPEWPRFRRADQYALNTFLMGFITLFAPLAKTYVTMAVYSACYGLLMGGCVPLLYSAIAEIGGANRMSSALGIIMFLRGIGNLAGPPFSGWLRDITGSFDATLLEGGGCLVLAGLLPFVLHLRVFQPASTDDKVGEHESDGTRLSLLVAEREESNTASTHNHETSVVIRETAV
ncbi:monocarboxylate transporter 13-like [Branchiostoma floridae x Branchiostoma japonicum]